MQHPRGPIPCCCLCQLLPTLPLPFTPALPPPRAHAVQMQDASGAMANPMYQSARSGMTGTEDIMRTADSMGGDYGEPARGTAGTGGIFSLQQETAAQAAGSSRARRGGGGHSATPQQPCLTWQRLVLCTQPQKSF